MREGFVFDSPKESCSLTNSGKTRHERKVGLRHLFIIEICLSVGHILEKVWV